MNSSALNLLPCPRVLRRRAGFYVLAKRAALRLDPSLRSDLGRAIVWRLQSEVVQAGAELVEKFLTRPPSPSTRAGASTSRAAICVVRSPSAPQNAEGYNLTIDRDGVRIEFREISGLRAAVATLRQLLRQFGRRLPCLTIRDWPDFPRRGVMLDISRGRVPRLATLLGLVDHLADFKINEFQLYLEHTFAYGRYRPVWRGWGALTGKEILRLDARCRERGIDLVPNQNSFGHLRYWLEHRPLRELAEVSEPYESEDGDYLRFPSTLAPNHPGTLPFLRGLYDELLRHFSSRYFNVGCDETWDLGRGQSKALCERKGRGRVYLDFLKKIRREVAARGRQMMFWGDIILHHPELIRELPKDVIALNWGYEAEHPFEREAALFSRAGLRFYVCPGTSTWMTLIGRHDNALANLRSVAESGRKHGAAGYLITDWGDGGHPQPLAVSYVPYLAGASLSWCAKTFDPALLAPVLNRDIFCDPTQRLGGAAQALGLAHRHFNYTTANSTPFGTTIAAPPPGVRELFCRNGLANYARIAPGAIHAARQEVKTQLAKIRRSRPATGPAKILAAELTLAARMAEQSCQIMLWQQALAAGHIRQARRLARSGLRELRALDRDFTAYWPLRNKGTPQKCSAFLRWRMQDYETGGRQVI